MKNKRNKFVCIGAVHKDYILQLQKKHYSNRTNPIKKQVILGGVAFNLSEKLAFLKANTKLLSLNIEKKFIQKINNKKITFKPINKLIFQRSYFSILNIKGEMILGMADMKNYEKRIPLNNNIIKKNDIIILDLNFSSFFINSIIRKFSKKNIIYVCGTSAHKVYKINKLLKFINLLILNKQECINLTNKKNIKESIKYIINKNKNLILVITNGKNKVYAYNKDYLYNLMPPKLKVINENKAGDTMSAYLIYYLNKDYDFPNVLKKAIAAGSLHVSGSKLTINKTLNKINFLSKKIKVYKQKYYA